MNRYELIGIGVLVIIIVFNDEKILWNNVFVTIQSFKN